MARQKGLIKLSGTDKRSDTVFVEGKYGGYTRALPRAGVRKDDAVLKKQYSRNSSLNLLAADIKNSIKVYTKDFAASNLYQLLLSRFRKEPSAVRVLLLEELQEMEVFPHYPLTKVCDEKMCTVKVSGKRIVAQLNVTAHAFNRMRCNCYFLEAVVLCWSSDENKCTHQSKKTAWISMKEELPLYCDLVFEQPAKAADFVVLLRCLRGYNNATEYTFPMQGMRVVYIGTMDKKAAALLDEKRALKYAWRTDGSHKKKIIADEPGVPMKKGKRK